MNIFTLVEIDLLVINSKLVRRICPPSRPGIGNKFIKARLTLIMAVNDNNEIIPALAESPAN